jgi:DNA-binding CsgD family transcriptional regulator
MWYLEVRDTLRGDPMNSRKKNRTDSRIMKYQEILDYVERGDIEVTDYYLDVLRMAVKGMTNPEIAVELDTTRGAIENVLNRASFKVVRFQRKNGTYTSSLKTGLQEQNKEKAIRLWDEGFNRNEIAAELDLSPGYVSDLVKEHARIRTSEVNAEWDGEDWVETMRDERREHVPMTRAEAEEIGRRADKAVIRRRLARGWNVAQMAISDDISRGMVLHSIWSNGFLDQISEDDRWVYTANNQKTEYVPGKKYWNGQNGR